MRTSILCLSILFTGCSQRTSPAPKQVYDVVPDLSISVDCTEYVEMVAWRLNGSVPWEINDDGSSAQDNVDYATYCADGEIAAICTQRCSDQESTMAACNEQCPWAHAADFVYTLYGRKATYYCAERTSAGSPFLQCSMQFNGAPPTSFECFGWGCEL